VSPAFLARSPLFGFGRTHVSGWFRFSGRYVHTTTLDEALCKARMGVAEQIGRGFRGVCRYGQCKWWVFSLGCADSFCDFCQPLAEFVLVKFVYVSCTRPLSAHKGYESNTCTDCEHDNHTQQYQPKLSSIGTGKRVHDSPVQIPRSGPLHLRNVTEPREAYTP
jgi:hypothetical protein